MSDSYFTVFLNSAFNKGDLLPVFTLFFLFLARFLPIIALAPFFGSRVLPHPVKIMFAISMFFIFFPELLILTTSPITFNLKAVLLMVKEMFIGVLMGFMISLPFMIVQNAGILIDHQRGGASLMVNDPTIQNQSSPLGTMFNYVMIIIFFWIDGPFLFIDTIVTSYEVVPPDQFLSPLFFDQNLPLWTTLIKILNNVMVISIRLATPALLMILMTDFFLGIANRLAPQVQITFLGMPLKSLLALLVICLGWNQLVSAFTKESYYWINQIVEMLKVIKGTSTL